ncbi:MAG TPA: hypothetical protein VEZ70_06885 [Allosphingosinicella sp.]|nr:hypothetical protein [Allosphingosinicella sp.]
MRKLILAASVLALSAPVIAQPYSDPRDEQIVRALPHPSQVEAVGDTVGRVAEAIMDVPVGPIADAIDPFRRGRHRDETLGDLAHRDDPYARERMRDQVGAATAGLGAIIGELAVMTPVLRRSLEDATRRMEDAMSRRGGRDYDRGYEGRDRDGSRR